MRLEAVLTEPTPDCKEEVSPEIGACIIMMMVMIMESSSAPHLPRVRERRTAFFRNTRNTKIVTVYRKTPTHRHTKVLTQIHKHIDIPHPYTHTHTHTHARTDARTLARTH